MKPITKTSKKNEIAAKPGQPNFLTATAHGNKNAVSRSKIINKIATISEENNDITFEADNLGATNKLLLHNLEFPFELRWRGSDAQTYKFWRVYMGVKASYNLSNNFKFTNETNSFSFSNVANYNTGQYGLTLSVGYDVFTAHVYYGLNPILKDTSLGTADISSKIMRVFLLSIF